MKARRSAYVLSGILPLFVASTVSLADYPNQVVTIKLERMRMTHPVIFSHRAHVEKQQIACYICHHLAEDAQNPKACITCHDAKEVNYGALVAKDAYHKMCQGCHKRTLKKGVSVPWRCRDCHHR